MASFNPGADNYTAARDQQRTPVATGVSNTDATQTLPIKIDSVTGRVLTTSVNGTAVINEVVSGSGTSWTLANTPVVGTVQLYANGQRLTPGAGPGGDYTISGTAITTTLSWTAGVILADYFM